MVIQKRLIVIFLVLVMAVGASAETWYVRVDGSDANACSSWATAGATVGVVNDSMSSGDTLLIGAGNYFNAGIIPPTGTDAANPTVYACSTYDSNSWLLPVLYAGYEIPGTWVVDSVAGTDSIWKVGYEPDSQFFENYKCYTMIQNDSLLVEISPHPDFYGDDPPAVSELDRQGKFWHDTLGAATDTFYARFWNDANPNDETIIASWYPNFYFSNQNHVRVYGLTLRCGKFANILWFGSTSSDSSYIEHCNLELVGFKGNENVGLVHADNSAPNWRHGNVIRACTLRYANGSHNGPMFDNPYEGHSGQAAVLYSVSSMVFDSCYIMRGRTQAEVLQMAIFFKNDLSSTDSSKFNVIKYTTVDSCINKGLDFGRYTYACSLYGNTINFVSECAVQLGFRETNNYEGHFIANNSFYSCGRFIWSRRTPSSGNTNIVKYNLGDDIVFVNDDVSSGYSMIYGDSLTSQRARVICDSNYWVDANRVFGGHIDSSGSMIWSVYNDSGFDVNGDTNSASVAFVDAANNNWALTAASAESLQWAASKTYGGGTWLGPGKDQTAYSEDAPAARPYLPFRRPE